MPRFSSMSKLNMRSLITQLRTIRRHLLGIEDVVAESRGLHRDDDDRDLLVCRAHAALRVALRLGHVVIPARQPREQLRQVGGALFFFLVDTAAARQSTDQKAQRHDAAPVVFSHTMPATVPDI